MAPIAIRSFLRDALMESLRRRQVVVVDSTGQPNTDQTDDDPTDAKTLTGGAIAGIVIGSIAGLLLLIWIFRSCSNLGAPPNAPPNPGGRAWYDGVGGSPAPALTHSRSRSREPRRSHSRRSHHHHHHRHSPSGSYRRSGEGVREVREVREVRPVAVVRGHSPYRHEERRSRSRSHGRY